VLPSFFDLDNRLQKLEAFGHRLWKLNKIRGWAGFRPLLMKIRRTPAKGPGGRPR
jgi:hypothetical protein